jgi:soluble lytic murein transglycosylase
LGRDSLYHPPTNVRLGIRYLFQMVQRYKDLGLALTAYYMGPNRLDSLLTKEADLPWQYASRVLTLYQDM